jgi:hypothetical protein
MKKDIEFRRLPDWMICGFDSFESYQDFYELVQDQVDYLNVAILDLTDYSKDWLPRQGDNLDARYISIIRELVDGEAIIV